MRTEYERLLDWAVNRANGGTNLDELLAEHEIATLDDARRYDEENGLEDEDTPSTK